MRTMSFLFGSMAAVAMLSATAETTVSDVTARQNWPWSGDVDIAFTLGGDKSDVSVSATWDGQSEPVVLDADLDVNLADLLPGKYTVRWTPPANTALPGFRVNVTPASFAARKYLVVDLQTGSYEFRAEPDNNWDDDVYRRSKMVFARIPAGTYTLGLTQEQLDASLPDESKAAANTPPSRQLPHNVTITHDYYMGCFLVSQGQCGAVTNGSSTSLLNTTASVLMLRGERTSGDKINWPTTGHRVSSGSLIGCFRDRVNLPSGWIVDMPTSAQWEIAARCGTETYFPDLPDNSNLDAYTSYLKNATWWYTATSPLTANPYYNAKGEAVSTAANIPVGSRSSNAWGVRDMLGLRVELVADWYWINSGSGSNVFKGWNAIKDYNSDTVGVFVDPVGPETANNRESRAQGYAATKTLGSFVPTYMSYTAENNSQDRCFRLCIDTHSLFKAN